MLINFGSDLDKLLEVSGLGQVIAGAERIAL